MCRHPVSCKRRAGTSFARVPPCSKHFQLRGAAMTIPPVNPNEIRNLAADAAPQRASDVLVRSGAVELVWVVLPAKERYLRHDAGDVTIVCLEGRVRFALAGATKVLQARELLRLAPDEPCIAEAMQDAGFLLIVARPRNGG